MQFAKKIPTIESELEKEIEEIRKVRKATLNDDDKQKQRYLETLTKRFTFSDLGKGVSLKFVECSVKTQEIGEIYKFINNTF